MSVKRKSESNPNSSSAPGKRARSSRDSANNNGRSSYRERPTVDASSGQTSAFPGLDGVDGDGQQDHDDADAEDDELTSTRAALKYLRSVRNEAQSMPSLLVAARGYDTVDEVHIGNGYYEDGAYVAAPRMGPFMPAQWTEQHGRGAEGAVYAFQALPSAQEACTHQLLANYKLAKQRLMSLRGKRKSAQGIIFQGGFKALNEIVFNIEPVPEQIAALSQDTILRMLQTAPQFLKRHRNISERFSTWIWSILCNLGEVGTLDSDAVSVIRELGKKAVWMGIGFVGAEEADATAEYGDKQAEEGIIDPDDDDAVAAKVCHVAQLQREHQPTSCRRRRNTSSPEPPDPEVVDLSSATSKEDASISVAQDTLLKSLTSTTALARTAIETEDLVRSCPDVNTCATIDMIVTLAGEVYGQRDLLEFRTVWSELWG